MALPDNGNEKYVDFIRFYTKLSLDLDQGFSFDEALSRTVEFFSVVGFKKYIPRVETVQDTSPIELNQNALDGISQWVENEEKGSK